MPSRKDSLRKMMEKVSVVIPAIDFDHALGLCLKSLITQKNVSLEVWVVFNPMRPVFVMSNWPDWIHFLQSKKGVNCARNLGMKQSTSDLVLFMDSDCQLMDPNHIEKLAAFMGRFPAAAGVGGRYELAIPASAASNAYQYLQMEWLMEQIESPDFRVRALLGGHMLLKKSVLLDLVFDENIIFGGSEKEFFCRLGKRNLPLFLDMKLSVLHNSQIERKQLAEKAKAQGRGEKYIEALHGKAKPRQLVYLEKLHLEPAWLADIEYYRKIFAKFAVAEVEKKFSFKKLLFRTLEHMSVAQSNKD